MNVYLKGARLYFGAIISMLMLLAACSQPDTPKAVSEKFWKAIQEKNMEQAKTLATWDTVDYLKYLQSEKIHPERFELGEARVGESSAEVVITLYGSKQGQSGVKVPGTTVLVKTEQGWRVNVKKTLASVVRRTVDNVFDQLNGLMRDGVKELDKALSESIKEIGEALEESANEIQKELSKPLAPPSSKTPKQEPRGQQI